MAPGLAGGGGGNPDAGGNIDLCVDDGLFDDTRQAFRKRQPTGTNRARSTPVIYAVFAALFRPFLIISQVLTGKTGCGV